MIVLIDENYKHKNHYYFEVNAQEGPMGPKLKIHPCDGNHQMSVFKVVSDNR